jgi:hypothetical protein
VTTGGAGGGPGDGTSSDQASAGAFETTVGLLEAAGGSPYAGLETPGNVGFGAGFATGIGSFAGAFLKA